MPQNTLSEKLQKAQALEKEANKLRWEAYEENRKVQMQKEDSFREQNKIDVYTSDDYCGLSAGRYSFYFGYEETACPVKSHRKNCEDNGCEKREWAFTADIDGKEVMRIGQSQLHPKEGEVPFWYLLAGIGHFLSKQEAK